MRTGIQINSEAVGLQSKPCDVTLTWRQTMNFAAGIEDANPHYFDDEREDGLVAPPLISVALTWPLSERFAEFWGDAVSPAVLLRQVHYTEHLQWFRPMSPGDTLHIQGEIVAITPRRSGTYMVVCYRATSDAGETVFEEHSGVVLRDVACTDAGRASKPLPEAPGPPPASAPLWQKRRAVSPLAAHVYDACANIVFPIHTSIRFAHAFGLPGTLLQGTATLAMAATELLNAEAGGDPARLQTLGGKFTGNVFPGSEIAVRLLKKETVGYTVGLFYDVLDADGQNAIRDGYATVAA